MSGHRLASRLAIHACALFGCVLFACTSDDAFDISVDVRTDLAPGLDFTRVETRVAPTPITMASDPLTAVLTDVVGADFISGHRVAEMEDVPRGVTYVEVRLIGSGGETLLSRSTIVELAAHYAVTLVLSSSCTGVLCPSGDDPVEHTACLGGTCVDPRCTAEDPTYCGEPQCTADDDCPSSGCRAGLCSDRVCLSQPDDALCPAGQTCGGGGMCVEGMVRVDSGVPTDTSTLDTATLDTSTLDTRPMTSGSYCPDDPLLRRQLALLLVRYEHGVDFVPPPATGIFTDVPTTSSFAPYIEQLARDGITAGCATDRFCPDDPVLRGQAATFLVRARYGPAFSPPAATGVFSDVPVGTPHAAAIEQIYRDGITAGCGAGLYCPSNPLLRRHFAVFLMRIIYGASYSPPPAVGLFGDVPITDPDARFIEKLAVDRFTTGC